MYFSINFLSKNKTLFLIKVLRNMENGDRITPWIYQGYRIYDNPYEYSRRFFDFLFRNLIIQ